VEVSKTRNACDVLYDARAALKTDQAVLVGATARFATTTIAMPQQQCHQMMIYSIPRRAHDFLWFAYGTTSIDST
jgi:hypothetical protein